MDLITEDEIRTSLPDMTEREIVELRANLLHGATSYTGINMMYYRRKMFTLGMLVHNYFIEKYLEHSNAPTPLQSSRDGEYTLTSNKGNFYRYVKVADYNMNQKTLQDKEGFREYRKAVEFPSRLVNPYLLD